MNNKFLLTIVLCWTLLIVNAQDYRYSIALDEMESDEITVELECPKITSEEIVFYFPKTVPGTYAELDYGRYIKGFSAFDEGGNLLKIKRKDINSFLISKASTLHTIRYKVEDTFDKKVSKRKRIFEPAGTGFEEDTYFVINNGGLFGCFEQMEDRNFLLDFRKDDNLKAYSSLVKITDKNSCRFEARDYHHLIDSPILFTNQKVEQLQVGNCLLSIASYSENDSTAIRIKEEIRPLFAAIELFTDSLPVKEYHILMFIDDQREIGEMLAAGKINFFKIPALIKLFSKGYGALEHGSSSFYFLPDFGIGDLNYTELLKDVVIHEFMHIYTPLNLHSKLVGDFDYQNPQMSKHLWLYEGVTEYFAIQIQMQGKLIDMQECFKDIRLKILNAQDYPTAVPFTEMSKNILKKKYKKLYAQVYERGALMAMLLDFEIMRLTSGEKTLKSVIFELSEKFGQNNAFDEDNFISLFVAHVHPELQTFFDNYVSGTTPLDIRSGFEVVGINYCKEQQSRIPINILSRKDNGVKIGLLGTNKLWEVKKVKKKDIAGFQIGDKVNKRDVITCFMDENGEFVPEGTIVQLSVLRDGKKVMLNFPANYKEGHLYHSIKINSNQTPLQQELFSIWTGAERAVR